MEQRVNKTVKRSGYIYSRNTKAGFSRQRKMGVPMPSFKTQDKLTRILKKVYKGLIIRLLADFKEAATGQKMTTDHAPLTLDGTYEELMDFFDKMAQEENQAKENQERAINQTKASLVQSELQKKWESGDFDISEFIKTRLEGVFKEDQKDFFKELHEYGDDEMQNALASFSLDKQKVFNQNMDNIRALYLDNAIERIKGEEDYLKRLFLTRLNDYITGKTEEFKFADIKQGFIDRSDNVARFFARDQMSRLNKAMTISTFMNAGVTKVKWITAHDVRVRRSHKDLDGRIFDISNLPDEIDDYNCRCGLVPVEYAD